MNDLDFGGDLRAALSRDADLVGQPSPDLLDQLGRRRQHQRRQRVALLGAVGAVVVIAAGIPIGVSLAAGSAPPPATQPVAPSPSPSPGEEALPTTPEPTPSATPSPEPSASSAPSVTSAAASRAAVATDPPCDWTAIDAALPPDTAQDSYALYRGDGELCVGPWAGAGYTQVITDAEGNKHPDGQAGLFHYVDGRWTFLDRLSHCDDPAIPRAVWERACNVD